MMVPALCVILMFFSKVHGALGKNVSQPNRFMTANVGDTVTLPCFHTVAFVSYTTWFKQPLGQEPLLITMIMNVRSGALFFNGFENNRRFSANVAEGTERTFNLTVSPVELSDSGTYYCSITRYNVMTFGVGTTLMVKGPDESHSRTVEVKQPESESVQPGDSVTLQCTVHTETCAGEHSVYWLRQGSGESPPGIIYTHGDRSDDCQRSSGAVSPTQSCVYKFPKRNLRLSDAGTYYCAVATCGEILFGNGTTLDFEGNAQQRRQLDTIQDTSEQCFNEDVVNYAALSFVEKNAKTRPKRREQKQDTIYSDIRNQSWN
ncbi:hypothetical protein GJAV_G00255820 [Gymnothorax javanicus]|nr:hypothetical protein GJAV_G00255820 [Gymnothorax javanicus]